MATLRLERLVKRFPDGTVAVDHLSLEVPDGALFTLLGPSGCGKTTTLRMIAGLETPTSGRILLDGDDFSVVPVNRRGIGMVFQSYALYPHMTVFDNVAYGLRVRKVGEKEIRARVQQALELVGLEEKLHRHPGELSGGQQQRVALARALVYEPRLLLLDEPLSNLDAKLRTQMREEIRRIQASAHITTIYVTHDQEEALAISDYIAVMDRGRLAQVGPPHEVYERPNSALVADFIGRANFLRCRVEAPRGAGGWRGVLADGTRVWAAQTGQEGAAAIAPGREALLFFRPEKAELVPEAAAPPPEDGASRIPATVLRVLYLGETIRYFLRRGDGSELVVSLRRRVPGLGEGDAALVVVNAEDATLYPGAEAAALGEGAA